MDDLPGSKVGGNWKSWRRVDAVTLATDSATEKLHSREESTRRAKLASVADPAFFPPGVYLPAADLRLLLEMSAELHAR